MKRLLLVGALALAAFVAAVTAFSGNAAVVRDARPAAKVTVPNVVGMRMDRATRTMHNAGLRVNEECSGLFGCIIKANWWICSQDPRPGTRLARYTVVYIYGERRGDC
jgi:hypothetical protein